MNLSIRNSLLRVTSSVVRPAAVCRLALAMTLAAAATSVVASGIHPELLAMPLEARAAVEHGQVAILTNAVAGQTYVTRVAAIVPSSPSVVLSAIRDYSQLPRVYPEMRGLTFDKGETRDHFKFQMKVHPLLGPVTFTKDVTWDFADNGDAGVDIRLLCSSLKRVEAQDWTFKLLRLDDESTLVIYETQDAYSGVLSKAKLLAKLSNCSERLVADVRARCLLHREVGARAGTGAALASAAAR